MARKKDVLLVFVLLALAYGYFYQDPSWNGNSRLGLIFAVVQEGRLTIDSFHQRADMATGDKAVYDNHYYSDKAIGTAVIGSLVYLPIYWLAQLLGQTLSTWFVKYLLTFFVIGLPSAFAGSLIYAACTRIAGSSVRAYIVTVAVTLGTMCLPYSIVFFGHQLAASLLFCAFFMILQLKVEPERYHQQHLFLLGLVLGLALITEYTAAAIVLLLLAYYFYVLCKAQLVRNSMVIAAPALGGLVPVTILLVYNVLCFGSPLSIGYEHLDNQLLRESMGRGLGGIGWPNPKVLYYLTIHPAYGLFWQSPVLLLALVGWKYLFHDQRYRMEAIVTVVAFGAYLLINAGYFMWWGGWSFGPRHLVPVLPLLCLPLVFVPRRLFFLVVILGFVSVFQMLVVAASAVLVPDNIISTIDRLSYFQYSSIYSYCWKQLASGSYAWNLGQQLFGLQQWASLLPLALALVGITAIFIAVARPLNPMGSAVRKAPVVLPRRDPGSEAR